MKKVRFAFVSALLVLAPLALAKLPVPNDTFGQLESALDFCAQVDPGEASKYQEKKKGLAQAATEKEVAEARASQEYKDAYAANTDNMSKEPKDEVKKTCTAALEADK